jgi:pSer/pThr/pTyr-binding forkhead associated (FHA) protein
VSELEHTYRLQIDEPGASPRIVVISEEVEVGRECDGIILDDPTASRRHVRLEPIEQGVILTDLGSSNGTIAGGELVEEPMVLAPGAWFEVGETRLTIHAAREGDRHNVRETEDVAAAERVSEQVRQLGQASAHTLRPGGPVRRPPRSTAGE